MGKNDSENKEKLIEIGLRFKSARLKKNLKRKELAEKCDVTDSYIGSIEAGKHFPSYNVFISICNALDITPNHILGAYIVHDKLNNEILAFLDMAPEEVIKYAKKILDLIIESKNIVVD